MARNKLETLRSLLNKAEHSDNAAEAATYRGKAFELAAEWEIEEAELFAKGEVTEKVTSFTLKIEKPIIQKMQLMNGIANSSSCDVIRIPGDVLHVFGFKGDVDRVRMIYASLVVQGERECRLATSQRGREYRRFARSFWQTYSGVINTRMQRAKAVATQSHGVGTELVLRDRSTAVKAAAGKFYPDLRKGRYTPGTRYQEGAEAGRAAGQRADLGTGHLGGRRKEID